MTVGVITGLLGLGIAVVAHLVAVVWFFAQLKGATASLAGALSKLEVDVKDIISRFQEINVTVNRLDVRLESVEKSLGKWNAREQGRERAAGG